MATPRGSPELLKSPTRQAIAEPHPKGSRTVTTPSLRALILSRHISYTSAEMAVTIPLAPDPFRIAAQNVLEMSFLGAGVILRFWQI
jgi:uncharacterized membrane protein YhiD involved in acid resistance